MCSSFILVALISPLCLSVEAKQYITEWVSAAIICVYLERLIKEAAHYLFIMQV